MKTETTKLSLKTLFILFVSPPLKQNCVNLDLVRPQDLTAGNFINFQKIVMDPSAGGGGDPPDGDIQDMEILSYSDDEDDSSTITPTPRLTLGSVFEILPTLKSGIQCLWNSMFLL